MEVNGVIVNEIRDEVPPPGVGVITDTFGDPDDAKSGIVMAAVSFVLLTKVVALEPPFHCTMQTGKNPDPFTVRVSGAAPACTLVGAIEETVGTG